MSWLITPTEKTPVDRLGIQNVALLLHGNGTNGSTNIVDSSPTPKTVTANGNAQISTAQSKFGGSSILFGGNGYLSVPDSLDLQMQISDFTIEAWIRLSQQSSSSQAIVSKYTTFAVATLFFAVIRNNHPSNPGGLFLLHGSTGFLFGSNLFNNNVWYHVAVSRSSGSLRAFVDGIQVDTTKTISGSASSNSTVRIGVSHDNDSYFFGNIDDIRITKGIARYTANFAPPTAPFPDL
jgi:hypothetical protein